MSPSTPEPAPAAVEAKPEPSTPKASLMDKTLEAVTSDREPAKPEKAAPVEKPEVDEPDAKVIPKHFREAYETTKAEKKRLSEELETFRKSSVDAKALKDQLEAMQKRNEEMEGTFRAHKFEASSEYKDKYLKPLEHIYNAALRDLNELEVTDASGNPRQATASDFETIVKLPIGRAIAHAKELFGDAAPTILAHRDKIKSITSEAQSAREHHQQRWQEMERESKAQSVTRNENMRELWNKANADLTTKYAEVFGDAEGDDEGNKLMASGRQLADLALLGNVEIPDEQRVRVHAEIRNRAAAFGREVVRRHKLESEVKELKSKLADFEKSVPSKGAATPPATKSKPRTMAEVLESITS
jgi:hypothetical protein